MTTFSSQETSPEKNILLDKNERRSGEAVSDSKENNSKEKILVVDDRRITGSDQQEATGAGLITR